MLNVADLPIKQPERHACLICFETFAEDDDGAVDAINHPVRKSYVFSSSMKKNKKMRIPCKCQHGKDQPEYIHQQCLWTWQNKLSKPTCPLCRQNLYDPRTIFQEAFLSEELNGVFLSNPVKEEWGVFQCVIKSATQNGSTRLVMRSEETGNVLLEARRVSAA